nr:transmembrane protein 143 [Anser cygnoides]
MLRAVARRRVLVAAPRRAVASLVAELARAKRRPRPLEPPGWEQEFRDSFVPLSKEQLRGLLLAEFHPSGGSRASFLAFAARLDRALQPRYQRLHEHLQVGPGRGGAPGGAMGRWGALWSAGGCYGAVLWGAMGRYGVLWGAVRCYRVLWGSTMGGYGALGGAMGCCEALWGAMGCCGVPQSAMGQYYGALWGAMGRCGVLWGSTGELWGTMGC